MRFVTICFLKPLIITINLKSMTGDTISIIADVCGILGFFISIFAATKVISLTRTKGDKNSQFTLGKKNKQKINTGDKK